MGRTISKTVDRKYSKYPRKVLDYEADNKLNRKLYC